MYDYFTADGLTYSICNGKHYVQNEALPQPMCYWKTEISPSQYNKAYRRKEARRA